MRPTKIVIIGAASVCFGPGCIRDAINCEGIRGSRLVLVDIDKEALDVMARFAHAVNDAAGAGLVIEHTTDRAQALPDAEFVITCIAIKRNDLWKLDWKIPLDYDIKHVLGENGGPGGLSHSLRNIPVILDICRDMEKLCPNARLLNFTNPESRMCLAISKYSSIKAVGLCHGIGMGISSIAHITGVPREDIDAKAAGLNHFTWMLSLHRKSTGEDIYPLLREKYVDCDPDYLPLTLAMMKHFGLYPNCSDDHIGEYLGYAWNKCVERGHDFEAADRRHERSRDQVTRIANGEPPAEDYLRHKSGEVEFDIIRGILADTNQLVEAVNIPNSGCISNLPADAVVEVPAIISSRGIQGLAMGDLPLGIAALCQTQVNIQKLCVESAVHGSRELALQALLIDPLITDMDAAEKCLDELLEVHADYLPQFQKGDRHI